MTTDCRRLAAAALAAILLAAACGGDDEVPAAAAPETTGAAETQHDQDMGDMDGHDYGSALEVAEVVPVPAVGGDGGGDGHGGGGDGHGGGGDGHDGGGGGGGDGGHGGGGGDGGGGDGHGGDGGHGDGGDGHGGGGGDGGGGDGHGDDGGHGDGGGGHGGGGGGDGGGGGGHDHHGHGSAGEPTRYDADVADSVQTIVVDVVGGAPVGGVQRVKVDLGSVVALMVTSDGAEEVHVHGYDILRGVSEGNPAHFAMTAEIPGVFEVELEGSGRLLLQLEIS